MAERSRGTSRADKPTGRTPAAKKAASESDRTGPPAEDTATRVHSTALEPLSVDTSSIGAAAQDIGSFIRTQREAAEVSIRQLAERAGVSNPYLSQIERGLRKPSAEVLAQIAKGLRLSAEVLYVRAGILEQREASPVRDAILTDPALTERQRDSLLQVYEAFLVTNLTATT